MATPTVNEFQLHQRLVGRHIDAIVEVYDHFSVMVYRVALHITHDRHTAEDITQDVLLGLWRQPERFNPERGGLRPWLATVAHNRSVDWIRREQAARGRDQAQQRREEAEPGLDIDDHVQAGLTAERVRDALLGLPEPEQEAIRLAYFSGRSYRQVAIDLNVPEGTIKSRIRTGLRHLALTMYSDDPAQH